MTYKLGIDISLHLFLFIILMLWTIENTDAMCGKPGRTPYCRHNDSKEEYEVDETVKYNCFDCYTLDSKERKCLQNGTWSGQIPVCHEILHLNNIKQLSLLNPGKEVSWANWSMDKDLTTCSKEDLDSGTVWQAVLSKTFQISMVKLILPGPASLNAVVKVKEGDKPSKTCAYFNRNITGNGQYSLAFLCDKSLLGDTVQITQRDRSFKFCEVSLYLQPGMKSCLRPDSPHMGIGSQKISDPKIYTLRCKPDYELLGGSIMVCQPNGTWSASSATCKKKIQCGQVLSISNGRLRFDGTSVNSTAFLECDEGYKPFSIDRIHCLPSGEWTSNSISCEAIRCDSNPAIHHGKGILLNNSTYFGSKLHIICDHGYTAIESEPRQCHENATWGNLDICVEINCGPLSPEATDGGQWIGLNGTISIRVLICEYGYYIEGSPAVTQCLSNGSWSYTTAVCKRSPINDGLSSEWAPSTLLMSAIAVGAGTAVCIVCLILSILMVKNRRRSKTNATVFHVGVSDSSLYSDGAKEQCYKNTYEDVTELKHNSFSLKPRKPSSALPHIPIDADPVYAQPFETAESEQTATVNTTDIYTAHIYAEPVNSHKPIGKNMYNNVAETWLKSGAKRFDRKMSLPARSMESSLSEDLPTSTNIAVCKPVYHSSNVKTNNTKFDDNCEKNEFKNDRQGKLELINNIIYSDVNEKSYSSCKDINHLQMIDNDIYQDDYFTNV